MKHVIAILTFTVAATMQSIADDSPWRVEERVDDITDEVSYIISSPGTPIFVAYYVKYHPELIVCMKPKSSRGDKLLYAADVIISIDYENFERESEIVTRYDREKATSELWRASTDRSAVFAPDWRKTIGKISSATNLTVRYMTSLGHIRTTTFDVCGLHEVLLDVKSRHLAR